MPVLVDAGTSWDYQDDQTLLEVRWDWDDDGTWDTEWTTEKRASHVYDAARVYSLRLQVRDAADGVGETARRVVRGPVVLRGSTRSVGVWEERCRPLPPDCSPVSREVATQAHGSWSTVFMLADQTSWIGVDTLRFDGGMRSGLQWPYHHLTVDFDVSFDVCLSTAYALQGSADCPGAASLRLQGPGRVLFELPQCGSARRDFVQSGVLPAGSYRLRAFLEGDDPHRMSCDLVFGAPGAGPDRTSSASAH